MFQVVMEAAETDGTAAEIEVTVVIVLIDDFEECLCQQFHYMY